MGFLKVRLAHLETSVRLPITVVSPVLSHAPLPDEGVARLLTRGMSPKIDPSRFYMLYDLHHA